jgi:hypothetical protein
MWSWYPKSPLRGVLVMQLLPAAAQCRHIPVLQTQTSAQTLNLFAVLFHSFYLLHFSALFSLAFYLLLSEGQAGTLQTFRSLILVLPIGCFFPSYSYYFTLLTSVQRVTWTLVFCASSRTDFLRFYSSAVRFAISGLFWCRIHFGNWIFGRCWVRLMGPAQIMCPYKTIQWVECHASPFARCSSGYGRAEHGDCSCWHGVCS